MTNRLAQETSPYLLQHKDNPVDWYPWGEEALEKARADDKPIFLSIGYAACHWCHVMEHESFEDPEIAQLMNENFVNIKVDREERPDLDAIYMSATQMLSGQGGWPMSVFLTPDGRPFYAGTYFPPDDMHGRPGFRRVIGGVADAYRRRKGEILSGTDRLLDQLQRQSGVRTSIEPLQRQTLSSAFQVLEKDFDDQHGGFGAAPKFPQPMTYEFLLRYWHANGNEQALKMVDLSLKKIARGGINDQLGGGFHRYSTDAVWLVPHFEKMLYDNALLVQLYVHAWQATHDDFYRYVADGVLTYIEREMLHPSGGFYSSQDADSEGEEGKYYVWWAPEIERVLGPELGRVAKLYWAVVQDGNFEGRSILWAPQDDELVAASLELTVPDLRAKISEARRKLRAVRDGRVKPGLDDKVLTAWNALALKGFVQAGAAFANSHYVDIARRNAQFLLANLVVDGRLLRTWKAENGIAGKAKLKGYLEDYAFLADALTTLYEASFEPRWLDDAVRLADSMVNLFWDADAGVFYDTGRDHEQLVVRPRDVFDNATPCGGSAAALALLRLARFTGRNEFERYAVSSIRSVSDFLGRSPSGFGTWLAAMDFYVSTPREIVVIGSKEDPGTERLLRVIHESYLPNCVVAGADGPVSDATSPLLAGRSMVDSKPAAYVCENYACQLPVTEPEALATQLGRR